MSVIRMNELRLTEGQIAFLWQIAEKLYAELDMACLGGPLSPMAKTVETEYRELNEAAVEQAAEIFEDAVDFAVIRWLDGDREPVEDIAKEYFLHQLAYQLTPELVPLFEKAGRYMAAAIDCRFYEALTAENYIPVVFTPPDLGAFRRSWTMAFTYTALSLAREGIDALSLSRILPRCDSMEKRTQIVEQLTGSITTRRDTEAGILRHTLNTLREDPLMFQKLCQQLRNSIHNWILAQKALVIES